MNQWLDSYQILWIHNGNITKKLIRFWCLYLIFKVTAGEKLKIYSWGTSGFSENTVTSSFLFFCFKVKLPELLLWHRRDFISDGQFTSVDYKSENEDLINFIVSQLDGDKERELRDLLCLDRIHEFSENISKPSVQNFEKIIG